MIGRPVPIWSAGTPPRPGARPPGGPADSGGGDARVLLVSMLDQE